MVGQGYAQTAVTIYSSAIQQIVGYKLLSSEFKNEVVRPLLKKVELDDISI